MHIPDSALPHGVEHVAVTGNTSNPTKALVLIHGRGASAHNIMQLVSNLTVPDEYIVIAPQAAEHVWYPERFVVPKSHNQPHLDSALERVATIVKFLESEFTIKTSEIVLAGFSQGACLVSEYLKQQPDTFAGAAVFSGGLIGDDTEVEAVSPGDLNQTSIYIGCDVEDFHIPKERVTTTNDVLTAMNAAVDLQLYEGLGHTIHTQGIAALQKFLTV